MESWTEMSVWTASTGYLAFHLGFHVVAVVVVLAREGLSPTVRLIWLVITVAFPFVGAVLYFRFGRPPDAWIRRRRGRVRERMERHLGDVVRPPGDAITLGSVELSRGANLILAGGGFPPCGGNRLTLFGDRPGEAHSNDALLTLADDIAAATSSCHLLFYIFLDDRMGQAIAARLEEAAGRGVACRLMVDAVGSRPFLKSALCRRLRDSGVAVGVSLPVKPWQLLLSRFDVRNHRKIVVIDGVVGWTGSQNLADSAFAPKARYAPWVDVFVRVEGPAVHDLQTVFVEDWLLDAGGELDELSTPRPAPLEGGVPVQILPTGPQASVGRPMQQLSQLAFLETDHELVLTTPYFVPDDATLAALCTTAASGVKTAMVVPKRNDSRLVGAASRGYYQALLDAGVEIHEFDKGLLHAKTFVFDSTLSVIATANLDRRSFELNYEVSMVVADSEFTSSVRALQSAYIQASEQVASGAWAGRPLRSRIWENFAGLLGPLL